jgi:hypothetical protein
MGLDWSQHSFFHCRLSCKCSGGQSSSSPGTRPSSTSGTCTCTSPWWSRSASWSRGCSRRACSRPVLWSVGCTCGPSCLVDVKRGNNEPKRCWSDNERHRNRFSHRHSSFFSTLLSKNWVMGSLLTQYGLDALYMAIRKLLSSILISNAERRAPGFCKKIAWYATWHLRLLNAARTKDYPRSPIVGQCP